MLLQVIHVFTTPDVTAGCVVLHLQKNVSMLSILAKARTGIQAALLCQLVVAVMQWQGHAEAEANKEVVQTLAKLKRCHVGGCKPCTYVPPSAIPVSPQDALTSQD